jgi:hypothetical protein
MDMRVLSSRQAGAASAGAVTALGRAAPLDADRPPPRQRSIIGYLHEGAAGAAEPPPPTTAEAREAEAAAGAAAGASASLQPTPERRAGNAAPKASGAARQRSSALAPAGDACGSVAANLLSDGSCCATADGSASAAPAAGDLRQWRCWCADVPRLTHDANLKDAVH